jgi:glycosyltransferase involved in cell wall biosynthesis
MAKQSPVKKTNIIMPVYNRPEHTKQAIDSLYANTNNEWFELVVVDDCSDKETVYLLNQLSVDYGFTVIKMKKNSGPGHARNVACEHITDWGIREHYLYFSDNDVYFKPDWLDVMLNVYKRVSQAGVGLLGAGCHPYLQPNEKILMPTFALENMRDQSGIEVYIRDAISGYSHMITWELWDRFGKFETQIGLEKKTGRSDDWEYCQRMMAQGFKVGSIMPEYVIACGKTDSYGQTAVGPETFKEYEGVTVR